jgi:hypothetical protein
MSKKTFFIAFLVLLLSIFAVVNHGFYIGFAKLANYKPNNAEKKVLNDSLNAFRKNPNFGDVYTREFFDEEKFGKPFFSENRGISMYENEKILKDLVGTIYSTSYFTKTEKTEVTEFFEWIVTENNEVRLVNYRVREISAKELFQRERRKYLTEKYPNEFILNLGHFIGPIEIRY